MRKNKVKIVSILLIILSIISIGINAYAHSGRTDSSGGHRDNKNKSGLGSYHYHCGGHPAHLHTNGVCPYSSSSSSSSSSTSSKTTTTKTTTVEVTKIQINEEIENIEIGDSSVLTTTITPNNATNKNVTWKSSDNSIATVSSTGKVTAKKSGTVEITAISANGKISTIKINVKEEPKVENYTAIKTSTDINDNTITSNQEDSDSLGGMLTLGLLGGGGYLGYKKYKNRK